MTEARAELVPLLGREPSPEWTLAGFGHGSPNSNAVPGTQEGRLQGAADLAIYLGQHPTCQVPAGGARQAANEAGNIQRAALNAKQQGFSALRRRLIALVDELSLLLGDDDPAPRFALACMTFTPWH